MDSPGPRLLKLGDVLNGTVVRPIGGRRFLVSTSQAPNGWTVELQTRNPDAIKTGVQMTFWIGRLNPQQSKVLVHDGSFGQLPISDAMSTRYKAGLQALLGQSELTADNLADVRAMASRITTRDQADWLTVWQLLGEPSPRTVQELSQALTALRAARKESPEAVPALLDKLRDTYGLIFERALRKL